MDWRNGVPSEPTYLYRIRPGGFPVGEGSGEGRTSPGRPPSPRENLAFRESLRRLRPPGLELMLQAAPGFEPGAPPEDPGFRRWETFPRQRKRHGSFSTSSSSSVDGTPVTTRNVNEFFLPIPRRLALMTDSQSNQSMLLQEAISESLCFPSGEAGNSSSRESPSQDVETSSYYSPILPDFFDNVTSSRLPSNIKELQMHLKAAQDECFTLKMSLHFLEEDYKRSLGAEDLTKENVRLKVEVVQLKDTVAKKNQLLQSALTVLQKSENPDLAAKEAEWAAERQEMEQRMKDMEQLWSQRVAELEHRLGFARDSSEPTSVGSALSQPSTAADTASGSYKTGTNSHDAEPTIMESASSLEQDGSEKLASKRRDREMNSLHSAVREKDLEIQQLLQERNRILEETHQKVADLMTLCTAKDVDIARLQAICRKQRLQEHDNKNNQSDSNNNMNDNDKKQENVNELLGQIQQLKSELNLVREEKTRVVEEAEIMDQQQQELSEQIHSLSRELSSVKKEKMELSTQLAASTAGKKDSNIQTVGTGEIDGLDDVQKLTNEVKRLRKESFEKDQRLQDVLQEKKILQERFREQQEERARTKLTTTESSSRPLFEPKLRRASSGSRSDSQDSHLSTTGIIPLDTPIAVPVPVPSDFVSPMGVNLSLMEGHDFINQELEGLTMEQLRERVLRTEALCWSMQSHLEDMAEFFSALLGNGDIKRFEKTLTPREVRKLRSLVDRTMNISVSVNSHTNRSQSDFLLNFTSSIMQEDEPENESRDRDLSVLSMTSHVKSFKDFVSGSETESVAIRSSGHGQEAGRSRRSRLSTTTDQSQLTPSLVQGLLEVLRRAEHTSQKLCSELETFSQSHLYKLLVEEILDKLKQENLLQGAVPGQEWEEVSQELESFRRRSQEVIHASAVARGCLKEGLEHLSKKSLSVTTSTFQGELQAENSLIPVSTSGTLKEAEDVGQGSAGLLDKVWMKSLVDAHYYLALALDGQVQKLFSQTNKSCGDGSYMPWGNTLDWSQLSKDLLDVWEGRETGTCTASWYKERLVVLPKAMSLLQQIVQNIFSMLTNSLEDYECSVKESSERLRTMEANQECRLKEIRQIQDWNLRLQAQQKMKENLLQSLKIRETELVQKIKDQAEEIKKLVTVHNSEEIVRHVRDQLNKALTETESFKSKNVEMVQKMKTQAVQIEKQVAELESQKGSMLELSDMLKTTQSKLVNAQEKEKVLSDLIDKVNVANTELESYAEGLKIKLSPNEEFRTDLSWNTLNCQLEAALSKLKNTESREKEIIEKMKCQNEEIKRLNNKLEAKEIAWSKDNEMRNEHSEVLEGLNSELESERKFAQKLRNQLDATLVKLEAVETREKMISSMMEKAVLARNELEVSVQDLKTVVQKEIADKYDAELKKLNFSLESTMSKLKNVEKKYVDVQQELTECQSKLKNSEQSWLRKLEIEVQKQAEMQLTIVAQNKEYGEANIQLKKISQQLESTLSKVENSEKEIRIRVAEVEEVHSRIKSLEVELEEEKGKAKKSSDDLEMWRQKDRKTRKELKVNKTELEAARKELSLVSNECQRLRQDNVGSKILTNSVDVDSSSRNAQKILDLEKETARLQEEVRKSEQLNQELQAKLLKYEEERKALNLNPAADTVYNQPLTSDDDQVPNKSPSKVVKSEPHRANDLLGEMKELKKEVVRNNHSSARLCRELQQHGHLYHNKPYHPENSATPQKRLPPSKNPTDSSRSNSSPDSAAAAAKRKQILDSINCETSSGTGSAETMTLLTASSETSFSSNPATSSEDLGTASRGPPPFHHSRTKEAFVSASFTDGTGQKSIHEGQFRRASASEERWARRSVSPISSRTSSESSLLHLKVLRQLGEEPDQKRTVDSVPDQDQTQNGDANPFFQYEGPLVLMLTPGSVGDASSVDEEAKECVLQRSNFSSPDLGIESDPNLISSRSSSTSSSESRPQLKGRIGTGASDKSAHRILVPCQPGSLPRQSLDNEDSSLKRSGLEPMRATRIFDASGQSATSSDNPGMMLHGLCSLRDLELLRQEVEEALVTLQGTKAAVRNRLDSKKLSSPAKSLEYSTLKEVDSRCLQLSEYLLRCRTLLDSFRTLPVATTQSWPSLQQISLGNGSKVGKQLQLLDSRELSLTASTETVCYKGDVQKGMEECETLREQVLNLQNKMQALEKEYKKALEQIKADKNRTNMVNRALEKQLSVTTKVIKRAKGNLKQSGTIEVVMYKESETTKNKCS